MSASKEAAIKVVTCLQQMGEQQSNPVLEIFEPQQPFVEDQKYPENKLLFNNGRWRAYYHCHAPPYRFKNEHGHFHIFYKHNENDWTHIAALSIDTQGQAQKWFVTNRWVTDEVWQQSDKFSGMIHKMPKAETLLLVETWLLAMLELYQQEIQLLLEHRDEKIIKLAQETSLEAVLEDREYYILAESEINLQQKLETELIE